MSKSSYSDGKKKKKRKRRKTAARQAVTGGTERKTKSKPPTLRAVPPDLRGASAPDVRLDTDVDSSLTGVRFGLNTDVITSLAEPISLIETQTSVSHLPVRELEERPLPTTNLVEVAPEVAPGSAQAAEPAPTQSVEPEKTSESAVESAPESALALSPNDAPAAVQIEKALSPPLLVHFRGNTFFSNTLIFCVCLLILALSGVPALILLELYKYLDIGSALNVVLMSQQLFLMLYAFTIGACLPTLLLVLFVAFLGRLEGSGCTIELGDDGIRQLPTGTFDAAARILSWVAPKLQKRVELSKLLTQLDHFWCNAFGGFSVLKPLSWESVQHVSVSASSVPESVGITIMTDQMLESGPRVKRVPLTGLPLRERQQLIARLRNSVPAERFGYTKIKRRFPHLTVQQFFSGATEVPEKKTGRIRAAGYTDLWFSGLLKLRRERQTDLLPPGTNLKDSTIRIMEPMDGGGLSNIYLAQRITLEPASLQPVVLKEFILPAVRDDDDDAENSSKQGFLGERNILAELQHPGIVSLLDSFVEDQRAYLVLEHIEGTSLQSLVECGGALAEDQVLHWAIEMCAILRYLHTPGIGKQSRNIDSADGGRRGSAVVHRDFTPHNIIVKANGELKVIDFNAALATYRKPDQKDDVVGKPAYIPPEQFRGRATTQSDLYALGASLFFMLTGEEPEPISQSHPRKVNTQVSEEMDRIVARATALNVSERYADADELMADLLILQQLQSPFSRGQSLTELVNGEGPLPEPRVIELALQLSEIIQAVRSQKTAKVHHQLIPANLFLQADGTLQFIGMSPKVSSGDGNVYPAGKVIYELPGNPSTVAGKSSAVNRRIASAGTNATDSLFLKRDISSLGETIYFLLTGIEAGGLRNLVPGDSVSCSQEINAIVARATNRHSSTDDEYQSLESMVADLLLARSRLSVTATTQMEPSADPCA